MEVEVGREMEELGFSSKRLNREFLIADIFSLNI